MLMAAVLLKRSWFRGSVNRCRKSFPLAPKIRTSPKNASQTGHYGAHARVCSRRWRVRLFNAFRWKLIIGFVCCQASFFSLCSSLECSLPGIPRTTWAALHKRSKEVRRPFPVASYREFSFRLPVRVFPLISWVMLILWANFRTKANLRAGRCCWQVYLKREA